MQSKLLSDGYIDFSGGMDSSRGASVIGKNQYVWSTNCILNKNRTGIACRPGYRPVEFVFDSKEDENLYKTGDFQGDGFYFNGTEAIILLSISGYIFQIREIGRYRYTANIINRGRQNNPENRNCYITGVKNAAVVNDGESAPVKAEINRSERVTGSFGIKAGHSGVYVQNRFFYIDQKRESIIASTIRNPFSLQEAYDQNIFGFTAPEDNDYITAIGKIATLRRDVSGGNLSFSTFNNNYSVDVRGARSSWGLLAGQGVGHVENSIPDIGAISPFSYESFNSNLYFRNIGLGLVSLKRSQSEYQSIDSYTSQSIEANRFFNNDSEIFLSQCRTKGYKERLFTTIYPYQKNNTVLWRGLLSYIPSFYSSSQEGVLPSLFESVYTGLNIHSILAIKYPDDFQDLFLNCVDKNGFNVMYVLDESINYDIDSGGKKHEIERKILTRAFDFSNPFFIKKGHSQSYSVSEISRDTDIKIYSRGSDDGKFYKQFETVHKIGTTIKKNVFKISSVKPQQRPHVSTAGDPVINDCCSSSNSSYFVRQDLIKILGPANLKRWIRTAEIQTPQTSVTKEGDAIPLKYQEEAVFTYKL